MKHLLVAIVLGFAVTGNTQAAIDTREFHDDAQRQRYHDLAEVLRCPKCQNQSIAESNSPIASDLRSEIHRMLEQGKSDEQILSFIAARYGDFVLYDPPLSGRTALLWLGPVILLLVGGSAVVAIVAGRRRSRPAAANVLSYAERKRLADLLQDAHQSNERES